MNNIDEQFDKIIQDAIEEARDLSRRAGQSREDYEQSLKGWLDEIRTEISAK